MNYTPWSVDPRDVSRVADALNHTVARVGMTNHKVGTDHARLISAAPDLLEALQRIANNFDESWVAGCVERQMGDIARAAIARATGETA